MTAPTHFNPVQPGDITEAVAVLTAAFATGPVIDWAEPDPAARPGLLEPYFTALLQHTAGSGIVHLARTDAWIAGVAVWTPSSAAGLDLDDLASSLPPSRAVHRLALLEKTVEQQRPGGVYHRLAYLAVLPEQHNDGIGSQLLDHHLHTLAAAQIPAYLEANHPRNRTLYQRHGFTDHAPPITVDGSPHIWPMWWPGPGHHPRQTADTTQHRGTGVSQAPR